MRDPMTSYEQAEAEADERFFEERDDMDAAAQQQRQKAQWRAFCVGGHSSPSVCPCIEPCASCGHLAAEHELTEGHRTHVIKAGECQRDECDCAQFTSDRDE